MFAIHIYWHPSPLRLFVSQFMLWMGYFRPVGGFFYLINFWLFGFNTVPYHAALLILLLVGAWQMWRFARAMGAGDLAAGIVALIACYHGGLSNLYYNSVFVFDVLCGIFYFAAFALYARARSSGRLLTSREKWGLLALHLCALNSKEMAITLPAMLLVYEWTFHGAPGRTRKEIGAWLRGPGQMVWWTGLLNLASIYGKMFGRYGLMKSPAYRPVYSWQRFMDFEERYIGDIFYSLPRLDWPTVLLIATVVTWFAWRRNRPLLRFCWFYIWITPLPIQFLEARDQACLYVPLAGWAIFAATLFVDWLPSATRVLSAEPLFRRLRPDRVRVLLIGLAVSAAAFGAWHYKHTAVEPYLQQLDPKTAAVLAEFKAVNPQVRPGSTVVFLEDAWPYSFDMAFVAELWFRDRHTRVVLNQKTPLSEAELAKADAIFTWQNDHLVRVR
jgi:hypothetical protein